MDVDNVNNGESIESVSTSDSESGAKRKGSPLQCDYPLKRQASFDDIYKLNQKGVVNKKKLIKSSKENPLPFPT